MGLRITVVAEREPVPLGLDMRGRKAGSVTTLRALREREGPAFLVPPEGGLRLVRGSVAKLRLGYSARWPGSAGRSPRLSAGFPLGAAHWDGTASRRRHSRLPAAPPALPDARAGDTVRPGRLRLAGPRALGLAP
jgi:hypothetical protein